MSNETREIGMACLSDVERQALSAICDALLPPIPKLENKRHLSALQASDNDLITRLEEWFEAVASAEEQRDLKMLLRGFEL